MSEHTVALYGTGSWGTAFAAIVADAGHQVQMWGRNEEVVEQIQAGCNRAYLPDLQLPEHITATTDPFEAARGASTAVLALPSQSLRANLTAWGAALRGCTSVVSLMKGVELGTGLRMSELIVETTDFAPAQVAVVSGPNLAREIAAKQPAASVVAAVDEDVATEVAELCHAAYFRPYTSTDVVGTEIAGALKNVIALAVGTAEGLGFGDNTKASLITRGVAEMTRLGSALGGSPSTFAGLAGVGDLIATCMSPLSRNHAFGVQLGQGRSVSEVAAQASQTAEGVKSCTSILALAKLHDIEVPIVEQIDALIHGGRAPHEVVAALLARPRKSEQD